MYLPSRPALKTAVLPPGAAHCHVSVSSPGFVRPRKHCHVSLHTSIKATTVIRCPSQSTSCPDSRLPFHPVALHFPRSRECFQSFCAASAADSLPRLQTPARRAGIFTYVIFVSAGDITAEWPLFAPDERSESPYTYHRRTALDPGQEPVLSHS